MARVTPKQAEKLLLELRESNDRGAIHWFSPPEPDPEQWPPGAELAPEILRAFWRDVSLGDEVDIPGALRPQAALAAETSAAHSVSPHSLLPQPTPTASRAVVVPTKRAGIARMGPPMGRRAGAAA